MALIRVPGARGAPAPRRTGTGVHGDQPGAEQPVVDAAGCGRLELIPERPVAQDRTGAEKSLDHGQGPGDVTVAEPLPDRGQCLRIAVYRVDGPQARQRRPAERHQRRLPAELGRVVIDRRQHPLAQRDPVDLAPAFHPLRIAALWPQQAACRNSRSRGICICNRAISAAVMSVLPSST